MSTEVQQLQAAIASLEGQRSLLGDALAEAALSPLRARLASLSPPDAPLQTLKQVTILFLDAVGSTTLSQHLDPEAIHEVMDGALARFTEIVESCRGRVLQYAGDSVLAVFGADEAAEDDPERAVRCGLALQAESQLVSEAVRRQHGHEGFSVRVGLHTGGVLLGGGVGGEGSIRGVAVNIAARMEQTAPAGGLRISHDTYRHVRGIFAVRAQPPLQVKGVDDPVTTYLVQGVKPRAFRVLTRGIEGIETRMIGRDAELDRLKEILTGLYRRGNLAAVTVVADAGLGKSRLLYEFENWAEARPERFALFHGRATPQTPNQPYGLLRDVFAWWLQIADSDSMDVAKAKLENAIAPLFVADVGADMAQGHAHLLGHLIGQDFSQSPHVRGIRDDAQQIRSRAFHAAAQVFRRVSVNDGMPVVLVLDDLHWADDGSLDFLNYLFQVNRDMPMLVLALARPSLFERRSDWTGQESIHQRIDLLPLDKSYSRALSDELLRKLPEIPAVLRELITGGAEGNPFYMEELVKMLIDEGAIQTDSLHWRLDADRLVKTHVPSTLTGVLQARLDRLQPQERLALQQAAVIGFVFWDSTLGAIDPVAAASLLALVRREFVVAHESSALDGAREYAFAHHLLHQVTYETLLKRTRRDLHARTAAWMAALTGARVNDFLGVIAEHFERADLRRPACEHYTRAAENAAARYAHDALLRYVAKALELAHGDDAGLRWKVLLLRERALDMQGRRAEQLADITALSDLAQAAADRNWLATAADRHCDFLESTGDRANALRTARVAMALAEQAGSAELLLRAQTRAARSLYRLGDTQAGMALAREGLEAARHQGLREMEGLYLNSLSVMSSLHGDVVACLSYDQEHLRICREVGNRRHEANALANLGGSFLGLGEHAMAQRHLDEGLRLARALGNRVGESTVLFNLSTLALRLGDAERAKAQAEAAVEIAVATQHPEAESFSRFCLASADLALGHFQESATNFERSLSMAREAGSPWALDAMAGLARLALAQGDLDAALAWLGEPLSQVAANGELAGAESPSGVLLTCHQVLKMAGDNARADGLLTLAHAQLQAKAETISDALLRRAFLGEIPEHRAVVASWAAMLPQSR
jgi:class 3 adenylate cyclase/tetratricopeptide (TPR) repeat protein